MKIIFYLGTCDTCTRILKELNPGPDVILQDIKKEKKQEQNVKEFSLNAFLIKKIYIFFNQNHPDQESAKISGKLKKNIALIIKEDLKIS